MLPLVDPVAPLVDPVAAPLWSEPVVPVLLGVVTDWLPLGDEELIPEFAGFAELFGFVEVSGCVLLGV